jgi:hypothetical protein
MMWNWNVDNKETGLMANARFLTKVTPARPQWEDPAGETLYAEYAKVEEFDLREYENRFPEDIPAVAIPANVEALEFLTTVPDARTVEAEEVWTRSAERHSSGKTLTEVMSGLESESDLFYAKTKLLRQSLVENEE